MLPRIQGLFHAVTEKRNHGVNTVCTTEAVTVGENSTSNNVKEKSIADEYNITNGNSTDIIEQTHDSEKQETEVIIKATPIDNIPVGSKKHPASCSCRNCDEIITRFSECGICLEPLQGSGPCACAWCGGIWCVRCSRKVGRCAWCRAPVRGQTNLCPALQRLVNDMSLPCRNYRRGCEEYLIASTRIKHEEECKFDQITCPVANNCNSLGFELLSEHLQSSHNIIAVYSQKIKILIENFQTKLKKTACCRTKYKIILLHHKSAFIIKVCIYNYHIKVEVMRRRLGYFADTKEIKKSDYCALIEFQSKALSTKSAVIIENESYSKKAEVQWSEVSLKPDTDEAITIHVNIGKSESAKSDTSL